LAWYAGGLSEVMEGRLTLRGGLEDTSCCVGRTGGRRVTGRREHSEEVQGFWLCLVLGLERVWKYEATQRMK
jgi:hypothetical protein